MRTEQFSGACCRDGREGFMASARVARRFGRARGADHFLEAGEWHVAPGVVVYKLRGMTAILSSGGEIVIPPEIANTARLKPGTRFEVTVSAGGDILLRRERPRQRTLLEHFQALRGLEPVRRRDPVPPLPEL